MPPCASRFPWAVAVMVLITVVLGLGQANGRSLERAGRLKKRSKCAGDYELALFCWQGNGKRSANSIKSTEFSNYEVDDGDNNGNSDGAEREIKRMPPGLLHRLMRQSIRNSMMFNGGPMRDIMTSSEKAEKKVVMPQHGTKKGTMMSSDEARRGTMTEEETEDDEASLAALAPVHHPTRGAHRTHVHSQAAFSNHRHKKIAT